MAKYSSSEFEGTFWTVQDGDYYVSTIGNDITGNGHPQTPYLTVAKAFEVSQDGEKIVVGPNEYLAFDNEGGVPTGALRPCKLATTGNIAVATGGMFVIDGVSTVPGDRILVWKQSNALENGIYIAGSGAWQRDAGFNAADNMLNGLLIPVALGNTYGKSIFQHITSGDIIVDQTAIAFEKAAITDWGEIQGDITNQTDLSDALAGKADQASLDTHTSDENNPHNVTKAQVGLDQVNNTSDVDKPVSDAQRTAINLKLDRSQVEDHLTSVVRSNALSANQGRVLKALIDNINTLLTSDDTTLDELQEIVTFIKQNKQDLDALSISNIAGLQDALDDIPTAGSGLTNNNGALDLGGTLTRDIVFDTETFSFIINKIEFTPDKIKNNNFGESFQITDYTDQSGLILGEDSDGNKNGHSLVGYGGGMSISSSEGKTQMFYSTGDSVQVGNLGVEINANSGSGVVINGAAGGITLNASGGGFNLNFNESMGNALINDHRTNPVGLQYNENYSDGFTNRSLVDKEYVDQKVSNAESYLNDTKYHTLKFKETATTPEYMWIEGSTSLEILSQEELSNITYDVWDKSTQTWTSQADLSALNIQLGTYSTGTYIKIRVNATVATGAEIAGLCIKNVPERTEVLLAPTNVEAVVNDAQTNRISWTNQADADEILIYRSETPDGEAILVGTVSGNQTEFLDDVNA